MRSAVRSILVISAALLCYIQGVSAQTAYSYPWCGTNGGGESCYYTSLEQCRATTAGGRGGTCRQSPWYRLEAAAGPRRHEAAAPRVAEPRIARQPRVSALASVPATRSAQTDGFSAPGAVDRRAAAIDYAAVIRSAEQGDATAQYNLAVMFDSGRGVPQDYVQAHMWYNLSAARFSTWEADVGASAMKNRDRLTARMTPEQIAEAQKMAREWAPKQ